MKKITLILALCALFAATAFCADPKPAEPQGQAGMPQMGPPAEMKELAPLVGTWDYTMKMKSDPSSDKWDETKMTCKCDYILDGAALTMDNQSLDLMMGMKYKGLGIATFDRETKTWQMTWIDNATGRAVIYSGEKQTGKMVFTGQDVMGGQTYLGRVTLFDPKGDSFDWSMEMSMDQGKTWLVVGTATYVKRK